MELLTKTRRLNRLLQKAAGHAVSFMDMSEVIRETIDVNIYVISRKGKILGYAANENLLTPELYHMVVQDKRISSEMNKSLLHIDETVSTDNDESPLHFYVSQIQQTFGSQTLTIIPIIGGRDRLGTLVISKAEDAFVDDDLILLEYGSTVIAMEILRQRHEDSKIEARQKAVVSVAVSSLSYSELDAVDHIFEELDGKEGLLVASKIADRAGITRSVIVNALRKLESAGVIETRSLGMKGTHIRILNDQLLTELEKTLH